VAAVGGVGVHVLGGVGLLGGEPGAFGGGRAGGDGLLGGPGTYRAGPMLASATRPPTVATPTIAQSLARRVNFW
jgi:hypothetical protein